MGRLRPADLLAGAAGVLLIGSLFLRWYAVVVPIGATGVRLQENLTGWQSFTVIDILLAIVGALAIAVPFAQVLREAPAVPVALTVLTSAGGILATLLVIFRLIAQPGPNRFVELQAGAWLGLAAALLVLAGGWLAMADERLPGARPPPVPRRPAPPREP